VNGKDLIHQYLLGKLDEDSVQQLNDLLASDPDLRREFAHATNVDAALREVSIERLIDEVQGRAEPVGRKANSKLSWLITAMLTASALLAVGLWMQQPQPIATILSSEDAAWESTLPTSPGAELTAGVLDLKTGLATIQFRSGAELTVEAPAQLQLLTDMRARLNSGAAVMNVPESATGFVLETPDGYAIDYGTRFAVSIDALRSRSDFELIEGEIEVHQPATGKWLRLDEVGAVASIFAESIQILEVERIDEPSAAPDNASGQVLRISTRGRCGVALVNEQRRKKSIRPGYLYASHTNNGKWDHRSFFEFDVTSFVGEELTGVKLRLNQVQSHRGSASLLPKLNQFEIYGMTNSAKSNWTPDAMWDVAPAPEDGVLVGTFEIPRSKMRGTIEIETPEIFSFVKAHGNSSITFILVRKTGRIGGAGSAMPHTFASNTHPEAVGPTLELKLKQ
jgi:hypothetical protein